MSAVEPGLGGVGRRSALALVGATISGVAMIATLIIASQSLTLTGAGEYLVAVSLFVIVQGLCSFGAETGFQYFVPTMGSASARRLVWTISLASLAAGAFVAVIAWMLSDPLGDLLSDGAAGSDTGSVVRSISLFLPFAGVYEVVMGALRAFDQILISTVLDRILRPAAQLTAMLVVAEVSASARGMVLAWILPNVVALAIGSVLMLRVRIASGGDEVIDVSQREFWRFTAPRSVARVAQTLTQRLDVLILAAFFPLEEVAIYGAASRCMIAGVFISTALRQTIQPQLRRQIVRGNVDLVRETYGVTTTWLVLVTWPVYLLMIAQAPIVMGVFGDGYERGGPALAMLSSAMLVATACGLVDVVLLMLGRSWLSTINVVGALVLNVVLNLLLAPQYGMVGSAIAWVVAILTTNVVPLAQTVRLAGLHPWGEPLAVAMSISVGAVMVPLLLGRLVFGVAIGPFLVASVSAGLLFVGVAHKFRRQLRLDALVGDSRRRLGAV